MSCDRGEVDEAERLYRRAIELDPDEANPADPVAVGDIGAAPRMGEMFYSAGHFDLASTNTWLWPGTSHGGSANLLFCDGHVESGRQTNGIAATDTTRRRWNNDHELHPETWARP